MEGLTARINRERVLRTLTFWLRPAFVLRVINRFQKVAGFDRAVALASSALTALIPLTILLGALLPHIGGKDSADRLIERYDLTGGGAEAVRDIFEPPNGASTSIGFIGALLLIVAVLSFTRGVQRLFEQTWELPPLSVRNSLNGLRWILVLTAYGILTGWLLSAQRIPWRGLVPFAVIGSILLAIYSVGATVYIPHLFSSYATRYGVIGAVFAMISSLFCTMVVIVGSAAAGHEVSAELGRIRRGERPADDEIRREWDNVIGELRSRWDVAREEFNRRRRRGKEPQASEAIGSSADGPGKDRSLAPPP
jgi:uncharacterized BrkB/YihY/UPF0761 family membrane protein